MPDSGVVNPVQNRDIIVMGASAGGLDPLRQILRALPADLPATVFIVLHMGAKSHLAEILARDTALPVLRAESGLPIHSGHVYVAVPGCHLLLHDSHLLLRRGPRENLCRPAIDPLFRSAACTFGSRVIGVVLSGSLNDGTAGLRAIKRCGGIAVVQDPDEALVRHMPESALRFTDIDHIAPAGAMGTVLTELTQEKAGKTPPIPPEIRFETMIAAQELAGMAAEDSLGTVSRFTCPECHGALWEIDDGRLLRFRCHVGHAYTADSMAAAQDVKADEMLWSILRSHQERAALARRMAEHERHLGRQAQAAEYDQRATGYAEDADVIRDLLRTYNASNGTEALEQDSP
ncbi:MAG: chemotaxis protein CheB [Acetobacteraceae bacterium]